MITELRFSLQQATERVQIEEGSGDTVGRKKRSEGQGNDSDKSNDGDCLLIDLPESFAVYRKDDRELACLGK